MIDRFEGSTHTETKVSVLAQYLQSYTTALRNKGFVLVYIDAFAGTGRFAIDVGQGGLFAEVVDEEGVVSRPGSARIAIMTVPAFDLIVLIEKEKKSVAALEALRDECGSGRVKIVRGEANETVLKLCKGVPWQVGRNLPKGMRAVIFLDPFGVNVDWTTIVEIGKTGAIDLWFLLNVEGIGRLLARDFERISASSRARLDRLFGGDWWQAEFYIRRDSGVRLDGSIESRTTRETPPKHIEQAYIERMKAHFGYVHPTGLRLYKGNRHSFTLLFAVANRSEKAKDAAKSMATWIIDNAGLVKRRGKRQAIVSGQMEML